MYLSPFLDLLRRFSCCFSALMKCVKKSDIVKYHLYRMEKLSKICDEQSRKVGRQTINNKHTTERKQTNKTRKQTYKTDNKHTKQRKQTCKTRTYKRKQTYKTKKTNIQNKNIQKKETNIQNKENKHRKKKKSKQFNSRAADNLQRTDVEACVCVLVCIKDFRKTKPPPPHKKKNKKKQVGPPRRGGGVGEVGFRINEMQKKTPRKIF